MILLEADTQIGIEILWRDQRKRGVGEPYKKCVCVWGGGGGEASKRSILSRTYVCLTIRTI